MILVGHRQEPSWIAAARHYPAIAWRCRMRSDAAAAADTVRGEPSQRTIELWPEPAGAITLGPQCQIEEVVAALTGAHCGQAVALGAGDSIFQILQSLRSKVHID